MTKRRTRSGRRLLIIENDDLIRGLIMRWLDEAGYTIAASDSQPGDVALVIADVPNPVQADVALKEIGARYGAPILVTSGRFSRGPGASKAAARRLGVVKVLPKPFTREELLGAVEACLDDA